MKHGRRLGFIALCFINPGARLFLLRAVSGAHERTRFDSAQASQKNDAHNTIDPAKTVLAFCLITHSRRQMYLAGITIHNLVIGPGVMGIC